MALSVERRKRSGSKDLPPDLSELMNKVIELSASFITMFDNNRPDMRRIVGKFQEIAAEVRKMQKRTDKVRTGGAVGLGVSLLGLFAAPFTGGASLGLAAAAGGAGGAVVAAANVTKTMKENGKAKEVEEHGEVFMKLVEPLKYKLQEIKTTCEKLEQKSTEALAKHSLSGMEEFQTILDRVSELKVKSEEALDLAITMLFNIDNMLKLLVAVFRFTATPEQDKKLTDSILQSADQCQKVVDEFDQMKNELRKFREAEAEAEEPQKKKQKDC